MQLRPIARLATKPPQRREPLGLVASTSISPCAGAADCRIGIGRMRTIVGPDAADLEETFEQDRRPALLDDELHRHRERHDRRKPRRNASSDRVRWRARPGLGEKGFVLGLILGRVGRILPRGGSLRVLAGDRPLGRRRQGLGIEDVAVRGVPHPAPVGKVCGRRSRSHSARRKRRRPYSQKYPTHIANIRHFFLSDKNIVAEIRAEVQYTPHVQSWSQQRCRAGS